MDSGVGESLGAAQGEITLSADGALRALNQVRDGLQSLDRQSRSQSGGLLSWASQNEQAINTVGTGLAGFGAVVLGAFGLATKTAVNFEAQMSAVGSVTGATGDTLAAMREEALRLGASTAFSASESAVAMEILAKAGATTEQILGGATEDVMNLAAATGVDVPLAAETAATAMNIFGTSSENAADTIAQSANASALDVNDWALALKAAGPVAASLGLDMEDLAQAMVILGDAGIKGETGGTALRNILMGLADPAGDASQGLRELGVETHNADGSFRGLEEVTHDLAAGWGEMDAAQKLQIATMIAGEQGAASFIALMDAQTAAVQEGSDAFQDASERMDETGTASTQAQARMDNFAGSMEELKGAVETVGIEFGSRLLPAFRKVVDGATKLIRKVLDLPGPVKTAIAAFTGIVGVLATLGGGFLLMLPRIASTMAALQSLGGVTGILGAIMGALLSPIGLIAIALTALAIIFHDEIATAVETVVDWFTKFVESSAHVQNMMDDLRVAFDAFKDGDYDKAFALVGRAAGELWKAIQEAVAEIDWGAVGATLLAGLAGLASFVAGFVLDLGSIAVSVAGWLWNQAVDLWSGLVSWAIGLVPEGEPVTVGSVAVAIAKWAFNALENIWDALTSWAVGGTQGDGTGGATAGTVGGITLGDVAVSIGKWVKGAIGSVWEWLQNLVSGSGLGGTYGDGTGGATAEKVGGVNLGDILVSIGQWLKGTWPDIQAFLKTTISDPLHHAVDLALDVDNLSMGGIRDFQDAVAGIKADWERIKSFVEWVRDADLSMGGIQDFGDAVAGIKADWQRIRSAAEWFTDTFTLGLGIQDFEDAIQGIKNDWQTAKDAASWFANDADFTMGGISDFADAVEGIKNDWEAIKGAAIFVKNLFSGGYGSDALTDQQEDVQYGGGGGGGTNIGTAPGGGTGAGGGPMRFMDGGGKGWANVSGQLAGLAESARIAGEAAGAALSQGFLNALPTFTAAVDGYSLQIDTTQAVWTAKGTTGGQSAGTAIAQGLLNVLPVWVTALQAWTPQITAQQPLMMAAGTAAGQGAGAAVSQGVLNTLSTFITTVTQWTTQISNQAGPMKAAGTSSGQSGGAGAAQGILNVLSTFITAVQTWAQQIRNQGGPMSSAGTSVGQQGGAATAQGVLNTMGTFGAAVGAFSTDLANAGGGLYSTGIGVGQQAGAGVAQGMLNTLPTVQAAASAIIAAVDSAMRAAARIASPSKLTTWIGEMLGMGPVKGLLSTTRDAVRAATQYTGAVLDAMQMGGYGVAGAPIPAAAYASPAASQPITYHIDNRQFFALQQDAYAELLANAERGGTYATARSQPHAVTQYLRRPR